MITIYVTHFSFPGDFNSSSLFLFGSILLVFHFLVFICFYFFCFLVYAMSFLPSLSFNAFVNVNVVNSVSRQAYQIIFQVFYSRHCPKRSPSPLALLASRDHWLRVSSHSLLSLHLTSASLSGLGSFISLTICFPFSWQMRILFLKNFILLYITP